MVICMENSRNVANGIFAVIFVLIILIYPAANLIVCGEDLIEDLSDIRVDQEPKEIIHMVETELEEELFFRQEMIEAYGFLNIVQGKKEDQSFDALKGKDNMLFSGNFWKGYGEDQKELAVRTRRLYDQLSVEGIQMGVVLYPMKVADEENRYYGLPYNDYSEISDEYSMWLRYYGVPLLDLYELCEMSGLTTQEVFFRTDHHWTPLGAFEGYKRIVDWMNEEFQANLDTDNVFRNLDSYEQVTYEDVMLGSEGRDTGLIFAGGLEDYTVIYPKEDGSYTLNWGTLEKYEVDNGSFQDALLELDDLANVADHIYDGDAERIYLHNSVSKYASIVNHETESDKKILLLRDSYSTPIGAFLAQSFAQVDMLWTLKMDEEELARFLEENHYDYVVIALYPKNLNAEAFPFGMMEEE